jgi:hypothetical protein
MKSQKSQLALYCSHGVLRDDVSVRKTTRSDLVTGADDVAQLLDVWESGVPGKSHNSAANGIH